MAKGLFRRVLEILDEFGTVRDFLRDMGVWNWLVTAALVVGAYIWAQSEGVSAPYRALLVTCVVVLAMWVALIIKVWSMVRPVATSADLARSHIIHLTFRIAEMAREEHTIRNRTFEDCTIYGPAIFFVSPAGLSGFERCSFSATSPEDLFWSMTLDRRYFGAIVLESCLFRRCRLVEIGLGGPEAVKQKIIEGFRDHS